MSGSFSAVGESALALMDWLSDLARPASTGATGNTVLTTAERRQVDYIRAECDLTAWAAHQAAGLPVLTGQALRLSPAEFDALQVRASCALAQPLGHFQVLERCGRVCLVSFVAARSRVDPILPLALIPLSPTYERRLSAFAQWIPVFSAMAPWEINRWWTRAQRRCSAAIRALARGRCDLTACELAYMVLKLQLAVAWPMGNHRSEDGSMQQGMVSA